jgi:PAS domain S-box-containing protein
MGDKKENPRQFLEETAGLFAKINELQTEIAEHCKNEERFRDIAENTPGWIWEVDTKGLFTYVAPVIKEVLGYELSEMLGKSFYDLFTPQSRDELKTKAFKIFGSVKAFREFINPCLHKNGDVVWISTSGSPMFDGDGKFSGYRGMNIDITKRKSAEEALAHQNDFQWLITNISTRFINLPTGETDSGINQALKTLGRFVGIDRSYIFQLSDDRKFLINTHEWCDKGIEPQIHNLQAVPVNMTSWWMDRINRMEDIYIPSVDDMPPEAGNEKKQFQAHSIQSLIGVPLVYDGSPIGFMGLDSVRGKRLWSAESVVLLKVAAEIFVNILMRKKVQQELDDYHEKMFRAEQLAGLGTISAMTVHELNQPLTVIQLLLQQASRQLHQGDGDKSKTVENITDSLAEISKVLTTINRLRNFARKTSPVDITVVDLAEISEKLINVLSDSAYRANVEITLNIENPPINIEGNTAEFEQMFFILIENAVQAADTADGQRLTISISRNADMIEMVFADSCGGIKEKNVERIFEPFFTTKLPEMGTGLGLCILQRIVKKYGGLIRLDNHPRKGTTFLISLPVQNNLV